MSRTSGQEFGHYRVEKVAEAFRGYPTTLVGCPTAQSLQQRPGEHAVHLTIRHGVLQRALSLCGECDEGRAGDASADLRPHQHFVNRDRLLIIHAAVHPEHGLAESLRLAKPPHPGMRIDILGAGLRCLRGEKGTFLEHGRESVSGEVQVKPVASSRLGLLFDPLELALDPRSCWLRIERVEKCEV